MPPSSTEDTRGRTSGFWAEVTTEQRRAFPASPAAPTLNREATVGIESLRVYLEGGR